MHLRQLALLSSIFIFSSSFCHTISMEYDPHVYTNSFGKKAVSSNLIALKLPNSMHGQNNFWREPIHYLRYHSLGRWTFSNAQLYVGMFQGCYHTKSLLPSHFSGYHRMVNIYGSSRARVPLLYISIFTVQGALCVNLPYQ